MVILQSGSYFDDFRNEPTLYEILSADWQDVQYETRVP